MLFKILIEKWIKGHCRHVCLLCTYKHECISSFKDELEKEKEND